MSESPEQEKDKMGQRLGLNFGLNKGIEFPQRLEDFGYQFNAEGQLRHIETGEAFIFEVKEGDRAYNQRHYEALGEVITEYVYKLLEEEVKLNKHFVPVDAKEDEGKSFIFMSDNAMTSDKLMILIHGSGVVRAGQWARRLIINDDLNCGTMLPYIKRAVKEGYGVLITNGNENYVQTKKKRQRIRGSESPERHFVYVWDNFISNAAAAKIVVVAHSYGGIVIVEGLQNCEGLLGRVKAVAFTDSVHSLPHQRANKKFIKWMRKNSRNWVSSDLPLDAPVTSLFKNADCDLVSAGTIKHEFTSYKAFDSVFKFFNERLSAQDESDTSEDQEDTPKNEPGDSENTMETAEDHADTPKNEPGDSQNTMETAEDQADTPKNEPGDLENTMETAEDQADTPKNEPGDSENTTAAGEDQADTPRNEPGDSVNAMETGEDQADTPTNEPGDSVNTMEAGEDQADTPKNEPGDSVNTMEAGEDQADTPKSEPGDSVNTMETADDDHNGPSQKEMDSSERQEDGSQMETDIPVTKL